jgi:predicted DNA-binding helix-hairpin-helix protein
VDPLQKLELLARETRYEPAEEISPAGRQAGGVAEGERTLPGLVHRACTPAGPVALLKGMVGNACERNCLYCPFRAGRDFRREVFSPDELALTFARLHQAGQAQGLFLSSGILGSGQRTQDQIIAVAEILRRRYRFGGYLHLKIMPGAEAEQIRRTMALADRVSINLEAPNGDRLASLAPRKDFREELVDPLRQVARIRQEAGGRPGMWSNPRRSGPSLTTQFVVGPAGESDRELLRTTAYLTRHLGLARAYFSAFRPIGGTPLEDQPAESPERERRLYQASFLLRDYGFGVEDLAFDQREHLPLDEDPKLAWARQHLAQAPLEINTASRQQLLRIPGIGPRLAERLVEARHKGQLRDLADLRRLGIHADQAAPFILLDGKRPPLQLRLFRA